MTDARRTAAVHSWATTTLLACLMMTAVACSEDPIGADIVERAKARATWQAQGLIYYTVEARILCFCPPSMNSWHELTVSSDSVIAIQALDSAFVDDPAQAMWFASVDEVYRRMERWGDGQSGFTVTALFDSATGLPTRVELKTPPNISDGNAVYEFRALKPGLTGQ